MQISESKSVICLIIFTSHLSNFVVTGNDIFFFAGYPPFCSESPQETYRKVLNWRTTLVFPDELPISDTARNLILSLCTDPDRRLGLPDVDTLKSHAFFK